MSDIISSETVFQPCSANLVEEAASLGLLRPEALTEARNLVDDFPNPSGLAEELVRRGLLTAFQAERLRIGRGRELIVGQYLLLDRLGAGGMGEVYKARHRRLDRLAALKVVRAELLALPGAVDRFHREARAAARLRHPNAVLVYDADQAGDAHFFTMEYVEGFDLARLVRERGPLPVAEACEYARQAALGLQHAHEQGLVHRDVKPSNLIVTRDAPGGPPVVKVLDFGLARFASETPEAGQLTDPGAAIGTLDFLAPEQAHDAHTADIRADVFGLGATLFYLLTGQPPFPGRTSTEKLAARLSGPARPVRSLRADVPPAPAAVVDRMLALDPAARYPTPGEAATALLPFTSAPAGAVPAGAAAPIQGTPPDSLAETVPHTAPPPRKRPRLRLALGGAAMLGLIGASLCLIYRSSFVPAPPGASSPPTPEHRPPPAAAALAPIPADAQAMWRVEGYEPPPELVRVLGEHRQRHWAPVTCIALSPDGKTLATFGADHSAGKDYVLRLWDVPPLADVGEGLRERGVVGVEFVVAALAFDADGRRLVGFTQDGRGRRWDLARGTATDLPPAPVPPGTFAWAPALDREGRRAAAVDAGNVLHVWDAETGQVERDFKPPEPVRCFALSPDGKYALTGAEALRLWDVKAGADLPALDEKLGPGGATAVTFSADGARAASGEWEGRVRVWDVAGRKALTDFRPGEPVAHVAFSADGRRVLTAGQGSPVIHVWDAADGREASRFTSRPPAVVPVIGQLVCGFAASGDGAVLSAGVDGAVRQWDLETGREPRPASGRGACGPLAFTDDGRLIAGGAFGPVTAWDLTSGEEAINPAWPKDSAPVLAFGPGGRSWLQVPNRFVDAASGKATDLPDEGQWTEAGAISPDGRTAALAKGGGATAEQIILWDVPGNKERGRLHHGLIYTPMMTFAPDGKTLLVGQQEKVRLFDWAADRELGEGLPCSSLLTAVFSPVPEPDGGWLLAVSDNLQRVRLCEVHGDAVQQRLDIKSLAENATTLAFAPDGKRLAAGTPGGRVLIWDPATGKDGPSWRLPGPVSGLAFSPDGRTLAVGGGNGTVYLFRIDAPGK